MLTASFLRQLEHSLGKKLKSKLHIRRVTPMAGGSINLAAKIDTSSGYFFLKVNDAFRYPNMFQKEANGLDTLRSVNAISIPHVIQTGEEEGNAFLVLEFIETKFRSNDFWKKFGESLAKLHKNQNDKFGFSENNYIGSLTQSNKEHNKWVDFFIEERLEQQLKLASAKGLLNEGDRKNFQKLYTRLDEMIPVEQPSLIHGDLWSGNFLTGKDGEACLIDPAVYYGHREMDLAMSKLFGGFEDEFYQSYHEHFPLYNGFDERVEVHNLYPLLVHVNLFGGGYVNDVRRICKKFA